MKDGNCLKIYLMGYIKNIFINHLGEKINHFKLKDVQKTNYTINTEKPCQQTMTIQK